MSQESEAPTPDAGTSKKKAKKDPKMPKGARSAYSMFMEEQHAVAKAENPDASFAQLSKAVSEKWKAISAEDKVKYEDLAVADKERFAQDMSAYVPSSGFGDDGKELAPSSPQAKKKRAKKEKDKNAPKGTALAASELRAVAAK